MAVATLQDRKERRSNIYNPGIFCVQRGMSFDQPSLTSGPGIPEAMALSTFDLKPETGHHSTGDTPTSQSTKKRRSSKSKAPTEIRRSASTPHMRGLALGDSGGLSPTADKRRNKLGYHRTSVACGHCRRRKIRCLVAPDDSQGRCSNCIRLKKECNFYPVDQHSSERNQSSAKVDGASVAGASTPSSPRTSKSSTHDANEDFSRYPHMHPSLPGQPFGLPAETEGVSPFQNTSGGPLPPNPFAYTHMDSPSWTGPTPFIGSASGSEESQSGVSSTFWTPTPSTTSTTYCSDPSSTGFNYPHSQIDEQGAAPPTRSLSYGNIEGLPQQFAQRALTPQQEFHRFSQYPFTPPIDTRAAALSNSSLSEAPSGSISAPVASQAFSPYSYQQPWNPYGSQGQADEAALAGQIAQWYSEPTSLGKVEEEQAPPVSYPGLSWQ